jgi:hypothetical protein
MDTGISISAFSSEKLQEFGIQNLDDLSANTPGLSISSSERITIRGVGIDSLALGIDPAVGTYMDGYYVRGVGPYTVNNFFDVEAGHAVWPQHGRRCHQHHQQEATAGVRG